MLPSFAESQPARAVVAHPVVVTSNVSAPVTDQQQSDDVQYSDQYQTFLSQQRIASQAHPASSSSDTGTEIKLGSSANHPQVAPQSSKHARSYEARRSVNKQLRSRKHNRHGHRTQSRSGGRGRLHSYNAQLRAYQIRLQQQQQRKEQKGTGTRSPQQPYRYYGNRSGYILPSIDLPSSSVGAAVAVRTVQVNQPFTSQVAQPRRPVVAPYQIHVRAENDAMSQGHASNIGQPGVTYDIPSGPRVVYATPTLNQPLQQGSSAIMVMADPYQQHSRGVQPLRAPSTLYDRLHIELPGDRQNQARLWTPSDYSWKISGFAKCSHTCGGGKHSNSFNKHQQLLGNCGRQLYIILLNDVSFH